MYYYAPKQTTWQGSNASLSGFDFSQALSSLGEWTQGKQKIDSAGLADKLVEFVPGKVSDFAKREQDTIAKGISEVRDMKDANSVQMGQKIGAIAGGVICGALGVGLAVAPLCGLVGGFIGGLIGGLFTPIDADFNEYDRHIRDKYFNPTGDKLEGSKKRQMQAIGRVWAAYGIDKMDSVVELIKCTRSKGLVLPKDSKICVNNNLNDWCGKPALFWYDSNTPVGRYQIVYYLGDWAKDVPAIDNYVAPTLTQVMDLLAGILERDQRCIAEANKETAKGYALVKMFSEGINTPNAIRLYGSAYDDGQSQAHAEILDPCSPYAEAMDKKRFEQRTGKPAECKDKDKDEPGSTSFLNQPATPIVAGSAVILGMLALKKFVL